MKRREYVYPKNNANHYTLITIFLLELKKSIIFAPRSIETM